MFIAVDWDEESVSRERVGGGEFTWDQLHSRQSPLISPNFTKDLFLFNIFLSFSATFCKHFFWGIFGLCPVLFVFLELVKTRTKIGD